MFPSPPMKTIHLPFVALAAFMMPTLHADLLVYEGFDPTDPSADLQAGQIAGATSKGFANGSKWEVAGSEDFTAVFTSDGLTMDGLASKGGSVQIGVGGSSRTALVNVFRQSGVTVPEGSTLYGSFLFRNEQGESRYLTMFGIETGEESEGPEGTTRGAHLVADNDTAMLVAFLPDSFARDEEGVPGRATQGVKVGKYRSHGSKAIGGQEFDLSNGETYLVVWSIDGTAGSGSPSGRNQPVTMWVLSQADLNTIRDKGDLSEAALDNNCTVRVAVNDGLLARLTEGDFLSMVATIGGGVKASSSSYDEIRIGTDIPSILPAP